MKTDIVIVGGGIAGCSAAYFLSRYGLRSVILERAFSPQDKVCLSYVTPRSMAYLYEMGIMKTLLSEGLIRITGIRGFSYNGNSFRGYYDSRYSHVNFGHTIPRHLLDDALVKKMKEIPEVTFFENWTVKEPMLDERGRVKGVCGVHDGKEKTIEANLVIDASGRESAFAKRFDLLEPMREHQRYVFMAYYSGVRQPEPLFTFGTTHEIGPGYFCACPVTSEKAIVATVVDANRWEKLKRFPEEWLDAFVIGDWPCREWMLSAKRTSRVTTKGPLAFTAKKFSMDGLLMVGDTTGFFDPLAGEGIGFALRSGEMAAETAVNLLRNGKSWERERWTYERTLQIEKNESLNQSMRMQRMLKSPSVFDRFVKALSQNREAADWAACSFAHMLPDGRRSSKHLFRLLTSQDSVALGE